MHTKTQVILIILVPPQKTSGHEIVNISKVPNNGNEHSEYEVNGVNGLSILEHSSPEPKKENNNLPRACFLYS